MAEHFYVRRHASVACPECQCPAAGGYGYVVCQEGSGARVASVTEHGWGKDAKAWAERIAAALNAAA